MENKEPLLFEAIWLVDDNSLQEAMNLVESVLMQRPDAAAANRLENIRSDYNLMLDYMLKGFQDTQREHLYKRLQRKLFGLIQDIDLAQQVTDNALYAEAERVAERRNLSNDMIKSVLEGFVADVTMLTLDEEGQQNRRAALYQRHQAFMNRLFAAVWTSPQWSDGDRRFYEDLLLSPTIDQNDVLLLLSAVMMGTMNIFDANKLQTLIHVYEYATDETVRQRALVGWTMTLPERYFTFYPEVEEMMSRLCASKTVGRELLELQKQFFFCLNTEKDNRQIQEDIMPTLMKNNHLDVSRFGIVEKEDDPMEDILHPDAADQRMEEVEASINKMMEMQKGGSDIYFGGFSQMKRFPFFTQMSNWFCPFFAEHPALAAVNSKLGDDRMSQLLSSTGAFCDSDKYSFALALSGIIDQLPSSVREMLGNEEAMGIQMPKNDTLSATYIRRMYLQDLYRFFKVFPMRNSLDNPFDRFFFASGWLVDPQVDMLKADLGMFLVKQKRMEYLQLLLDAVADDNNAAFDLLRGYDEENMSNYEEACNWFRKVLEKDPENERAMKELARCSICYGDYEEAAGQYGQLLQRYPNSKLYALNRVVSLLHLSENDEATELLYKLFYEYPDDTRVKRVYAWDCLCKKKVEKAQQEYDGLLAGTPTKEDYLNAGYCKWVSGDVAMAVQLFCQYKRQAGDSTLLEEAMLRDQSMLKDFNITTTEIFLMADLVRKELK